jgi:hypothetical protein
MAFFADGTQPPCAFVNEPIPEAAKALLDPQRLYHPLGMHRWPEGQWTVDRLRNVALVSGGSNSHLLAMPDAPVHFWKTLLVDGLPAGLVFRLERDWLPGQDLRSGRTHELLRLRETHLYLPAGLRERESEVVALAEEAYYAYSRGPVRAWIRSVVIDVAQAHPDTDYRRERHPL